MKVAFVLFDRMTALDFIGFYEAITRLKIMKLMEGVSWDLCADKAEVTDELGVTMKVDLVRPDMSEYDLVFVPGGMGTRALRSDEGFVRWLQTAKPVTYKVSVCTGALLLGAAGFLEGKRVTTNASAFALLAPYCKEVVQARIVRDGNVITGGGVAASIDLGLFVVELLCGLDAVRLVQTAMDYPYYEAGRVGGDYTV